ncbi:hypothetical protein SAMN05444128_0396 [Pontibacter indicus]|uniref:Uncharacterized protein n=1 Tax=Pontibacter indicus TaxID=1317125 RepID=A0A1R3WFT9_9BACT|nr:hypothetical protein SAMN05444128_0396 [Pontibacter indicus]
MRLFVSPRLALYLLEGTSNLRITYVIPFLLNIKIPPFPNSDWVGFSRYTDSQVYAVQKN